MQNMAIHWKKKIVIVVYIWNMCVSDKRVICETVSEIFRLNIMYKQPIFKA